MKKIFVIARFSLNRTFIRYNWGTNLIQIKPVEKPSHFEGLEDVLDVLVLRRRNFPVRDVVGPGFGRGKLRLGQFLEAIDVGIGV